MRSSTPLISYHDRLPILSVDIQQRNDSNATYLRLATCGLDAHIVIWKVAVDSHTKENVIDSVLSDLKHHDKGVNVVRFAPKCAGNLLASGDDDGYIIVWQLSETQPTKKSDDIVMHDGNSNEFNDSLKYEELWVTLKVLRRVHIESINDLCWSPDGRYLMSGSVDNRVKMWNCKNFSECLDVKGSGWVQGIAWDPLNQYLMSLSSDRKLRVFNPNTGKIIYNVFRDTTKIENNITKKNLFYDDSFPAFSRRLCFSPNGEFVLVPSGIVEDCDGSSSQNSQSKFINVTYLFLRADLKKPAAYYPTGKSYTLAVRCCPIPYQLKKSETRKPLIELPYRIVFAVATKDSVIVYDTEQSIPLVVVKNIHYSRLTDVSWSSDGNLLATASADGYCTYITFADGELGIPYDGPLYTCEIEKVEKVEKVEKTPKLKQPKKSLEIKKTPEISSKSRQITAFFTPRPKEVPDCEVDVPQTNGIKRPNVELIDLADSESPVKKANVLDEKIIDTQPLVACENTAKSDANSTGVSSSPVSAIAVKKSESSGTKPPRRIALTTLSTSSRMKKP